MSPILSTTTSAAEEAAAKAKAEMEKKRKKEERKKRMETRKSEREREAASSPKPMDWEEATTGNELEDIRKRILNSIGYDGLIGEGGEGPPGIQISETRGEWMMIIDERFGLLLFYNKKTKELKSEKPKGWIKMLAMRFNK